MSMHPILEKLGPTIKKYNELRARYKITAEAPEEFRNIALSVIIGRMEAISADKNKDENEFKLCQFLFHALKNGWLVSDIHLLVKVYDSINLNENELSKSNGLDVLGQLATEKIDTVQKRYLMLDIIWHYFSTNNFTYSEQAHIDYSINYFKDSRTKDKNIYKQEYPLDTDFDSYSHDVRGARIAKYAYISDNTVLQNANKKKQDDLAREKTTYVRRAISETEKQNNRLRPFVQSDAQRHNRIIKTNRQVICEVFGEDIYDEIDEMSIGSTEERTVPIYHSQGTKWAREGHEVLEMHFAGSGATDVPNFHKGRTSELNLDGMSADAIREKYGERVQKSGNINYDYIFKQSKQITTNNNTEVQKVKYTIGGSNPSFYGLFNLGDYSIESCRENAQRFAKEFLEPHFNRWLNNTEPKHDMYIICHGHSRGGVSAGQAVKYIHNWITDYMNRHRNNPRAEDLKQYIHYDLRTVESVPGAVTNLRHGSIDLSDVPNLEATTICSMAQENLDILYPLQYINGAKRIILTTTDHIGDVADVDNSQNQIAGDMRAHADAYYDAETGEMYRRSGLNQMPEGVYVADEDKNLIRVTSYSQLGRIFSTLYGTESPQSIRCKNIHKMVRDWFYKNDLKMSFPDEKTRGEETEKNLMTEDRILKSPNKRLAPIQSELRTLIALRSEDAPGNQIIQQQENLIRACRFYMKKTTIPAKSSDSEYRINLVSDLLSYSMRERNYLAKILNNEINANTRFELDEKISAFRNRLNNKEGYLNRKKLNDNSRLKRERNILNSVKKIAAECQTELDKLQNTSYFIGDSDIYKDYHNALLEGSKLSDKSSPREISELLIRLTEVSDNYITSRDTIIGPIFDDGKKRLTSAKHMAEFSKRYGRDIESQIKYYGDKDQPIGTRITNRTVSVKNLTQKIEDMKNAKKLEPIPKIPEPKHI